MLEISIIDHDTDANEAVLEIKTNILVGKDDKNSDIVFDNKTYKSISMIAYSHPHSTLSSQKIGLFAFMCSNIQTEAAMSSPIKTTDGYFSYHLFARVVRDNAPHVQVGDVDIFLDTPFPKDILDDTIISFDVICLHVIHGR